MQEWKASEKEAQKMTRDGAISVNLVTGEATHVSDRPPGTGLFQRRHRL